MLIVCGCKTNPKITGEYSRATFSGEFTRDKLILIDDSTFIYTVDKNPFVSDSIFGNWVKKWGNTVVLKSKCDRDIEKKIDYILGEKDGFVLIVDFINVNLKSTINNYYECFVYYSDTILSVVSDKYGCVNFPNQYGGVDSIFISTYHKMESQIEPILIPLQYKGRVDSLFVQIPIFDIQCVNDYVVKVENDSSVIFKR